MLRMTVSEAVPEPRGLRGASGTLHGSVRGGATLLNARRLGSGLIQVLTMISEGKPLDEVMAARPTAAYDATWGQEASWTANDFVPIVFHELGGGRSTCNEAEIDAMRMNRRDVIKDVARTVWSIVCLLGLSLAVGPVPVSAQLADDTLVGVIDFHCHSGPDSRPRSVTDIEIARLAKRAGMRGLVFKNHYTMTADRAALAMQVVEGIEIFGGVALNRAVGGLNAEAVRQMTQFAGGRGKVVWLPTFDAEYWVTRGSSDGPYVSVVTDGKPAPELAEIFQLIADNDLVLAMGHSSPEEALLLLSEARSRGVRNILITHVLEQNPTRAQVQRMADQGAIMELVYPGVRRFTIEDYIEVIRAVGAQHFLISSDLGQYLNPLHTDGLKDFITTLREHAISESDIDMMARRNPARLLGLDP